MRALLAAAAAVTLLTVPAFAQDFSAGKGQHRREQTTDTRKKGDDKSYKDTLAKMPDQKFDPWRNVRPEGTTTNPPGR